MSTLKRTVVWLSIAMFFIYTGIEITVGQWSFTLFTESRGVLPEVAGVWISIYWGSVTAGRLFIGFVTGRIGNTRLIRLCILGMLVGSVLFSLRGYTSLNFLGLAITGFALAPLFPLLVSITPDRVGRRHAANAIGFQIGAAALGGAILPGLTGVLARNLSLEVVGPVLIASSLIFFGLHELTVWEAVRRLERESIRQ